MGIQGRIWEILPLAILWIAVGHTSARADSISPDPFDTPASARFVPGSIDWNDSFTIAGTMVDETEHASAVAPEQPRSSEPLNLNSPQTSTESPVHVLPLPSTVWSGVVLLGASAGIFWIRKRRAAGEISAA
jgi:hypothetical protein